MPGFASIPSPGSGAIELGPLTFRAYGVMIALGVLAAVWLAGRRFAERGYSSDHATGLAMWAVPAGVVGARLYHVITDWQKFEGNWGDAFKIWEGGLGILGGVLLGVVAGLAYMRRHGIPYSVGLDVCAPALPLAQAIGRWGNWFNQELFGGPTDLPWGLEIDPENRPAEYADVETFHPTFLYESLWNLGAVVVLLRIDRTRRLAAGHLFAAYLALYSIGRLWVEALRVDEANEIAGVRVNIWVFSIVLVISAAIAVRGLRRDGDPVDLAADVSGGADDGSAATDPEALDGNHAGDDADPADVPDGVDDDAADVRGRRK
jgi:prolipoprotein diacylglyceryl transferase